MKKIRFKNRKLLVAAICYGLFAVLWLGVALLRFVGDGMRTPQALAAAVAMCENLAITEDGAWMSENVDPQLIFEGLNAKVRLVRLKAAFKTDPGEMELFYARGEGDGFSLRRRVIGMPQDDGSYLYALPPGRLAALRLDPGAAGNNRMEIAEITLNPRLPASFYFVPNLRWGMAFLLVPGLALCVIYTIIEGVGIAAKHRQNRN